MGKESKRKRKASDGKESKRPVPNEGGIASLLSGRYGFAVALFIIAGTALLIYSNTFFSPFSY
jgi:hypothetical protein